MFGYLVLLFTIVPAVELFILLEVGEMIGAGNTFLLIIFTGVLGAYLARLQGFLVLKKIQGNLNQGSMPSSELLDGLMILVGGIVLLTPGFITDAIGFLLLIPITRSAIKWAVQKHFENMIKNGQVVSFTQNRRSKYDDIDVN